MSAIKTVANEKRLIKLMREVNAVLIENRTARLRVKVHDGIGATTYELRMVKTEANFEFKASGSGVKKRRAR